MRGDVQLFHHAKETRRHDPYRCDTPPQPQRPADPCCRRRRNAIGPRAGLPEQTDPHRRALRCRRGHRCAGPRLRREAVCPPGPAGRDRQQGRGRRHSGHRHRGQGRARWLHLAGLAQHLDADQPVPVPEAALQPGEGPGADVATGVGTDHAGRASRPAREDRRTRASWPTAPGAWARMPTWRVPT